MKYTHTRIFVLLFMMFAALLAANNATGKRVRDTLHFRKAIAERVKLELADSELNDIGIDSLLNKIEGIYYNLININNTTRSGFDIKDIQEGLSEVDSNIGIIDENITAYSSVLDVKNLQMFDILLISLQNQLGEWRTTLGDYNKDLKRMSNEIVGYGKDTILEALVEDSAFKSMYQQEITDLDRKMDTAKARVGRNLNNISQLEASLSSQYFETIDLHNKITRMLQKISVKSMGKEYDYLWDMHEIPDSTQEKTQQKIRDSYKGQLKILKYYFIRNKNDQLWMLLTGVLFSLWIFYNFKKIEKLKNNHLHIHKFLILRKSVVIPTLVVLFNLAPFFDIHPPTAYVDIMEFMLVITMTILVWRIWHRKLFMYWVMICILYFTISITGAILTPDKGFRIFLFTLNIVAAVFGFFWYRMVRKNTLVFSGMIKIVSVIYILLNILAACCNMFGRLSLSKVMSVTSVHTLTLIVGLSLFIQIVTEAFHLQTTVNQLKGGLTAKLNFNKIQNLLGISLKITAITLWAIVFSISLNIYNVLFTNLAEFLTKPRKVGTTTFEYGSILLFIVIIFISNLLQKGVGSLYGKGDEAWDPEVKKNGSRLAMTRLVMLVLGFLVAIAASGLPVDKITIVLGALGVGIGLGLQSIVNNLVSGIILIFEQPFRIGDFIQVGGDKGRVLDIGIRSSKLLMEEGAEVVLPNADLLSGRVINWTNRNEHVRIQIPMNVATSINYDEVKQLINNSLADNEHLVKELPLEILLSGMKDNQISFSIFLWINSVHMQQFIKSELIYKITNDLAAHDVKQV